MFNPHAFENSRPGGIAVLEVAERDKRRGAGLRFVPLRRTELHGEVIGPLAALRLVQVFAFTREQCSRTIEAVYRFPLPGDAAVTGVRVAFGEVLIEATLKRREEAEADYREAMSAGKQAALAARESPDVFSLLVAGIQPGQEVRVEATYVQLARAERTGWSLRVPITTAPRYARTDERTGHHADGQPLGLLHDPGHRFALELLVRGAEEVSSATHDLTLCPDGDGVRVHLVGGEVLPDRDCVLTWRAAENGGRSPLRVYVHDAGEEGYVHFMAVVVPPPEARATQALPREVLLLVDHSGSMSGPKWEAADWAVLRFLEGLGLEEWFDLGVFHDRTRWLSPTPVPGDAAHVARATRFLREQQDSGGTELGVALEQALHVERRAGELARHVLLLTDAEVTDAGRILQLADGEATRAQRRRISVLCIDAAPNAFLVHELARRGGGLARFLTSDPKEGDITTALDKVLEDWAQPVLSDLHLAVNRTDLRLAGHATHPLPGEAACSGDLGDLPAGRPMWVAGRVPRGSGPLVFSLRSRDGQLAEECVDVERARHQRGAIASLFGAWRLLELEYLAHARHSRSELAEFLQRLGYAPADVLGQADVDDRVYAENARRDIAAALRALLARESLAYGLPTSEASFVAVRQEAGQPVEGTVPVANALPAGWSDDFLAPSAPIRSGGTVYSAFSAPPRRSGSLGEALARAQGMMGSDEGPAAPLERRTMSRPAGRGPDVRGPRSSGPGEVLIFRGVPRFDDVGQAVLYDSARDPAGRLPAPVRFGALVVRIAEYVEPTRPEEEIALLLYVADMAEPAAVVRLSDLLQAGGVRPLNVARQAGERVLLRLVAPTPAAQKAPMLDVTLVW